MNISGISAQYASAPMTDALSTNRSKPSTEAGKLKESCRQFEAILWRDVLDKATTPMQGSGIEDSDKTGTYKYFMTNTLADAVSGGNASFSNRLYAQLSKNLPKNPPSTTSLK